jgi:hypothetical protein
MRKRGIAVTLEVYNLEEIVPKNAAGPVALVKGWIRDAKVLRQAVLLSLNSWGDKRQGSPGGNTVEDRSVTSLPIKGDHWEMKPHDVKISFVDRLPLRQIPFG